MCHVLIPKRRLLTKFNIDVKLNEQAVNDTYKETGPYRYIYFQKKSDKYRFFCRYF